MPTRLRRRGQHSPRPLRGDEILVAHGVVGDGEFEHPVLCQNSDSHDIPKRRPTALGPVANTDTKLLIYGLFQKSRVLAQDGNTYPTTMADSSSLWKGANC